MAQITKLDIIVNLLTLNGPMTRKDLMREVARIEGKPFRPTSNHCYFAKPSTGSGFYKTTDETSLVAKGYIRVAGKKGNAYLWGLTPKGCTYLITARQNMAAMAATLARLVLDVPA